MAKLLWTTAITAWISTAITQSILLKQPISACLVSFQISHC